MSGVDSIHKRTRPGCTPPSYTNASVGADLSCPPPIYRPPEANSSLPDTFWNRLVPGTHKGPSTPNPAPWSHDESGTYTSSGPPPRSCVHRTVAWWWGGPRNVVARGGVERCGALVGARCGIILLTVILTALQFVLPAAAFAALARVAPNPPSDPAFARAEVSVVRLMVDYNTSSSPPSHLGSTLQCTGLGILVGSWLVTGANAKDPYVNWVLTDAALLNQTSAVCAPPNTAPVSLASIDVFPNTVYTNMHLSNTLGTLMCQTTTACTTAGLSVTSDFLSVNASAMLFSFRSAAPQPFVDIAIQDLTPDLTIRLTDARGGLPLPLIALNNQAQNFLNPLAVPLNSNTTTTSTPATSKQNVEEPGTPSVNAAGQVVSIQVGSGPLAVTQANMLLQKQPPLPTPSQRTKTNLHTNPLQDAWNAGIEDFYGVSPLTQPNHAAAAQEFALATKANPAFRAPAMLYIENGLGQASPTPATTPPTVPTSTVSHPSSFFGNSWLLLGIGLLGLIILLVGTGLLLRARAHQKELARFEAERSETELKVQLQQQARQAQGATPVNKASPSRPTPVPEAPKVLNTPAQPQSQLTPPLPRQAQPLQQAAATVNTPGTTTHVQTASDLRCPNCGRFVQVGASYCPNCRYQLSSEGARFFAPVEAPHAKAGTVGELLRKDERNDVESVGARSIAPAGPGGVSAVPQTQEAPVEATPENASIEARLRRLWSQSE